MPKGRLYFDGDDGIQKDSRTYKLRSDIAQKIENVPAVIDNTSSSSRTDALSANMGRDLQEQINNLAARGRYLSTRNAATGLPDTNPQTSPYVYRAGDYYIVSNIGVTNYRPQGASYTIGVASTAQEHGAVSVNDLYIYDGVQWILQGSTSTSVSWGSIVGNISNQGDLQNALDNKQDELVAGEGIRIDANNVISNTLPGAIVDATAPSNPAQGDLWYDTTNNKLKTFDGTNWNETGVTYVAGTNIQIDTTTNTISATDTIYRAGKHIEVVDNTISANGLQEELTAGNNISIETVCTTESTRKGPCPKGFHVLSDIELKAMFDVFDALGLPSTDWIPYLKLPAGGYRLGGYGWPTSGGRYWTSSAQREYGGWTVFNQNNARQFYFDTNFVLGTYVSTASATNRTYAMSIRPYKNTPVAPDNTWTTIYDGSSIAAGAGIFWNVNDGLISFSSDGTNWTTIADKNVGATQVWNYGDAYTDANCGSLFQRGNNHPFSRDGNIKFIRTTVDAREFGPGNYYYGEAFVSQYTSGRDLSKNNDLWGMVSNGTFEECGPVISATQTGTEWGDITGTLSDQTDLQTALNAKQDKMSAGNNISIDGTTINARDTEYEAGNNITITCPTESDMKGPCPSGFHVPLDSEWSTIIDTLALLGFGRNGDTLSTYLKIPMIGGRVYYYTSSTYGGYPRCDAIILTGANSYLSLQTQGMGRSYSIRPRKNSPVAPDNTRTTIYDGSSIAAGAGIFHNATEGIISVSPDGANWITIADKNLGATVVYNNGDTQNEANCGKYYQRGNNYGFPGVGSSEQKKESAEFVDTTGYGPGNYYYSDVYRTTGRHRQSGNGNKNLRGGQTRGTWQDCEHPIISAAGGATYTAGTGIDITNNEISADTTVLATQTDLNSKQDELIAGDNITIGDAYTTESDMKGPAPDGFHVPSITEWEGLKTIMDGLSLTTGTDWRENLRIPSAGIRNRTDAATGGAGGFGSYWSSSPMSSPNNAHYLYISGADVSLIYEGTRTFGYSIRCFKDSYVVPTSSWTVVQGTLGNAGIFRNQTEGLISITSDGTTGYTIADKNLGATTVWNNGDTLSEANCGKYYQRGNNYGFPFTGNVSTSSTQVDTTGYGPGNYYTGADFIVGIPGSTDDWSNPSNDNLRGGVTQGTWQDCIHNVISSTDTTYTAGNGISIDANNEISVDNTIARAADVNTKTFYLTGTTGEANMAVAREIHEWMSAGNTALIHYGDNIYTYRGYVTGTTIDGWEFRNLSIIRHGIPDIYDYVRASIRIVIKNGSVYQIRYSSSTEVVVSQGYVDNNDTYIGSSAPTNNVVEGALWYDTTNDVLKVYDGTDFVVVNTDTTYSAGTGLTLSGTTFSADTTVLATKQDIADLGSFEVVASLPSVSTADTKTIYLLGPIGTGTDKYEEWIVTEDAQQQKQWTKIGETSVDLTNYFNTSTQNSDAITEGNTNLFLTSAERTILGNTSGTNTGDQTATDFDIKDLTDSTGLRTTWSGKQDALVSGTNIKTINSNSILGSGDLSIAEVSSGGTEGQVLTKGVSGYGWEDLPDMEAYELVDSLPTVSQADENKIYILDLGDDKYEEWIIKDVEPGFVSDSPVTKVSFNETIAGGNDYTWSGPGSIYMGFNNLSVTGDSYDVQIYDNFETYPDTIDLTQQTMPYVYEANSMHEGRIIQLCRSPYVYVPNNGSSDVTFSMDLWYSSSPVTWDAGGKVWAKVTDPVTEAYVNSLGFKVFSGNTLAAIGADIASWLTSMGDQGTDATFHPFAVSWNNMIWIRRNTYSDNEGNRRIYVQGIAPSATNYNNGTSILKFNLMVIDFSYSSGTWTYVSASDTWQTSHDGRYIRADYNYSNPYVPVYNGSPTTKLYVDDRDTYIGTSAPTSNLVEGRLWYDTTNDVLKVYDGTNWHTVDTDTNTTYSAGNGISIDSNNEISIDTSVVAEVSDVNVKAFYMNYVSETSIAQDAYDWYRNGGTPLLCYGGTEPYVLYDVEEMIPGDGTMTFRRSRGLSYSSVTFTYSDYTVTNVTTAGGSYGNLGIQNDTTGTTSTVAKIWSGTQAEYDLLSTYDTTTIYYII